MQLKIKTIKHFPCYKEACHKYCFYKLQYRHFSLSQLLCFKFSFCSSLIIFIVLIDFYLTTNFYLIFFQNNTQFQACKFGIVFTLTYCNYTYKSTAILSQQKPLVLHSFYGYAHTSTDIYISVLKGTHLQWQFNTQLWVFKYFSQNKIYSATYF